jgi:hypothetical protein
LSSRRWTFVLFCTPTTVSASAVIPHRTSLIRATALPCEAVGLRGLLASWDRTHESPHHSRSSASQPSQPLLSSCFLHPLTTRHQRRQSPPIRPTTVSSHSSSSREWELPTSYQPSTPPSQTSPHHHPTHHHDQSIKTIVAAGPWELPTPCQSPMDSRQPHHDHHPTDTIRPDTTPPTTTTSTNKDFNHQPNSSRAAGNCLLPVLSQGSTDQHPPRPPATHPDTALPPKPLFPTNKLAARPFDTAEASAPTS